MARRILDILRRASAALSLRRTLGGVVLAPLEFSKNAVALAFAFKTPEGFIPSLTLTQFDENHSKNSPPF